MKKNNECSQIVHSFVRLFISSLRHTKKKKKKKKTKKKLKKKKKKKKT